MALSAQTGGGLPRFPSTDTIGRCKATLRQLTPAVVWLWVINEAKVILTQKNSKVNSPPQDFSRQSPVVSKNPRKRPIAMPVPLPFNSVSYRMDLSLWS